MPYAIGIVLALLVALFVRRTGFDRDRAAYPLILIVTVSYYVLFAVLGGSVRALTVESVVVLGFAVFAVVGFAGNLWWVVAALLGHGAFDLVHGRLIANPGVPAWWPAFCLSFDVGFAAWLAALLIPKASSAPHGGSEFHLNTATPGAPREYRQHIIPGR